MDKADAAKEEQDVLVEEDEHLEGQAAIVRIRQLLADFKTAMLVTTSADGHDVHVRPLGLQGDPTVFGGTLWFFVDDRSRKIRELESRPRASLVFQSDADSRYPQLDGTATTVVDKAKMRELYTPIVKTWFPDGLDDPHLTLLRFDATGGSFWDSPGGVLKAVTAFTKSVVTGTPGRSGRAGTLNLG